MLAQAGGTHGPAAAAADGPGLAGLAHTAGAQRFLCQEEMGTRCFLSQKATPAPSRGHPWVAPGLGVSHTP